MIAAAWPYVNAALFLVQLCVNKVGSRDIPRVSRENETLITPAGYAFSIWGLIYLLLGVLVGVDLFASEASLFVVATHPAWLRMLFALSCCANIAWVTLFSRNHVQAATLVILALWGVLLLLYAAVRQTSATQGFHFAQYVASELGVTIYFAWCSAATAISVAMSLQKIKNDFLATASYLALLGALSLAGLTAIVFLHDWAFGATVVWALTAIAASTFPWADAATERASDKIRACSAQNAALLAALLVVTMVITSV